MTKQLKIAIGLPHYQGKSSFEHTRMWMQFGHTLACSDERFKLVCFALVDVCGIDKARNACVEAAFKADADWLLMIDGDTWVDDGGDLLQMISDADKLDATIVGAAVRRRVTGRESVFMAYRTPPENINGITEPNHGEYVSCTEAYLKATSYFDSENLNKQHHSLWESFCPVDAMATACMAINLRHVQFMEQPFFEFTRLESEDLDFCRRVREMRDGWMLLNAAGKPDPDGEKQPWHGHIFVDRRIKAFHLNRAAILEGL